MTKKDFENFIRSNLKDLSLEEQEKILIKIRRTWMPDIIKKFDNRIEKSYNHCPKCGKYSLKKKCRVETKEVTDYGVTVYTDCGYGDDDEIADVTYLVYYNVCPVCGGLTEKNRYEIRETNRHRRK